jgi:hypothetical protein
VFGAVGTLQNVASIISMQITPVVVPVEVPGVVPVTTCAATGDVAKSSAEGMLPMRLRVRRAI